MSCKQHLADPSAAVGVCATCLRERLLSLIDAQSQPLPLPPPSDADRRNPKLPPQHLPPPPPPIVFPRSVSPYISRRKSDTADADPEFADKQRFFSTPQPPPAGNKKKSKFRVFSNLFRSGSAKSRHSSEPELYSSSKSGRRNSILRLSSLDETGRRGRGMSPDVDSEIGCSPDSWKRTPSSVHGSNRPRVTASPARSQLASGFGFCLSPLMRPSPARHLKGSEAGYSGEIRPAPNPHLSTAASLRANRSRKLADFGRFNHNR